MRNLVIPTTPALEHRRTTSDHIADALRTAINNGQLEDGAILNQVQLAENFGVSRVPVREAIRRLEAEGLIEASPHQRAVVRGLSIERVSEIYELRGLLEGHLVAKAAPNVTAAGLKQLESANAALTRESAHSRWLELNTKFHTLLYAPSRRPTALDLVETLRLRSERYVQMWSSGSGLERSEQVIAEHAEIIEYMRAKDAEGARDAVQRHISHTRDAVLEMYRSSQAATTDDAG